MRSSTIVPGSFSKPKFGYRYVLPKPVKKVVVEKTKEKKDPILEFTKKIVLLTFLVVGSVIMIVLANKLSPIGLYEGALVFSLLTAGMLLVVIGIFNKFSK